MCKKNQRCELTKAFRIKWRKRKRIFQSEFFHLSALTDPIMPKFWPRTLGPGIGGTLGAVLLGFILLLVSPNVGAYNDENPMLKWSPNYLFGSGGDGVGNRVPKSVYAYDNTLSPRVSFLTFLCVKPD